MTPFGAVQSSITNDSITPTAPPPTPSAAATTDPLGDEETFLTLLVAQIKYQDPTQPADATTFVTQLAQFSDLEQQIGSHSDLDAIKLDLTPPAAAATTTPSTQAGSTAATEPSVTTTTGTPATP
jgi:flagellar basal-body rod modification protein FlgD